MGGPCNRLPQKAGAAALAHGRAGWRPLSRNAALLEREVRRPHDSNVMQSGVDESCGTRGFVGLVGKP
jgi:hypothetical protein